MGAVLQAGLRALQSVQLLGCHGRKGLKHAGEDALPAAQPTPSRVYKAGLPVAYRLVSVRCGVFSC